MLEETFKTAVHHHSKKNFSQAKKIYEDLIKSNPNNFLILQNYATLLSQMKLFKKAAEVFKKCLTIKPNDSLLLYNYAKFFHDQKIYDRAVKLYHESFNLNPKSYMCLYNIGKIHFSKNELDKAIKNFNKSLEINPSNYLAYNNIGLSYKKLGNFTDALNYYKKAIELNKNYVDCHVNYGTLLLLTNNLKLGFEEYEWRKKSKNFTDYLNYLKLQIKTPEWTGQTLENKTILVFTEQGIGDLIQFARYIYVLKDEYKCKVILRLKHNLSHFFDNKIKIITEEEEIPIHDFHNHLVSLPGIFYKKNKNFPKNINFIKENKDLDKKWREILSKYKGLKVGINSTASSATTGDRIIPIDHFKSLTNLKNINFFIIQKDFDKNNIKVINQNSNVNYFEDLDKSGKAFQDTIGLIKNLDLIITADTSLGHLSATLEKPTWIALSFINDWRWFSNSEKSIWYDKVKLYRQKTIGNWKEVFVKIRNDLEKKI